MHKAVYSGTFDPITKGHIDIIKRASKLFDEVIVAVAKSSEKSPMFSLAQREEMIQATLKKHKLKSVKVIPFQGLLVDFCQKHHSRVIIRGVRSVKDFEYELQMAYANASLYSELETLCLMPSLKHSFISSSIVRAILAFDGKVKHLMPKPAYKCMRRY